MWNPSLGLPAPWQGPRFPQANPNINQQPRVNQQRGEPRPPGTTETPNVYSNLSQFPQNPNGVVMAQQHHNHYQPIPGPSIMQPPLWRATGGHQPPLMQNQTRLQFPTRPMHMDPGMMAPSGIRNVLNPQFPRNHMPLNPQTMGPRVIPGQHPVFLPNSGNPQFPMNVNQRTRLRTLMSNPPLMHNLPIPAMHVAPMSVNQHSTAVPRAKNPIHHSGSFVPSSFNTNARLPNTHTQVEPERNIRNNIHILTPPVDRTHMDSQGIVPNPTTTKSPSYSALDTEIRQDQYQNESISTTLRSTLNEQQGSLSTLHHTRDQWKAKDALVNEYHIHEDQLDGIECSNSITPPEMDSVTFTNDEEMLSTRVDEGETNHCTDTSPDKKRKKISPLRNHHRRIEDFEGNNDTPRKRTPDKRLSSSQRTRKVPRYDNESENLEYDKSYAQRDRKRGNSSSESRSRTSSSNSIGSYHSRIRGDRHKGLIRSKSSSLERHQNDSRSWDYRPLRCVSPPAPDVERVLKFIVPDDYYKLTKSKKDSKSVTLGTEKLEELYETFENKILNPATAENEDDGELQSLKTNAIIKTPKDNNRKFDDDDDAGIYSDFDSLDDFDLRVQKRKGQYSADTFDDANDSEESTDEDEGDEDDDDKYDDNTSDSSSDESSSTMTGQSVQEVRARKIADPRRLHPDLWFNEIGEGNDGPVCKCCAKDREHGIQHAVYPGEKSIPLCNPLGNNADRLYHYWVTVTPHTNFMTERPTTIRYHNRNYVFEGFSILSHQSLDKIPICSLIRFNIEYSLHLVREPFPKNFCIKGLDMVSKFLFSDILELLDWSLNGQEEDSCPMFHFMPRFVFRKQDYHDEEKEVHELLPMNKVISYLIESSEPLVEPDHLKLSQQKERDLSKSCRNLVVTRPNKKPAAFRIDDLEFDDNCHDDKKKYPVVVHHGIRPAQMSYSGDLKYQKLWKSFLRLRNTAANRPVSSRKYQDRLIEMKVKLEKMRLNSSMRRDVQVKVNSQGLMKTGFHSDICQHAMLFPVLVHHLRYHICLRTLDNNIGYIFEDRMLLQLSLSHPSYHLNFGMNPDQARNTLSNCGVKQPRYGDRRIHQLHTKKKGVSQLIRVMANLGKIEENQSMIRHNERLEFLGDSVLEFICSSHLYFMLPEKSEGHLSTYRSALVQNSNLARLAKSLNLCDYMQYAHGPDLCKEDDMNHAMANCFEALLGAVFLENGLQAATDFFSSVEFKDEEIRKVWLNVSKHPLQQQHPDGDRHFIKASPVLQNLQEFEESTGVHFTHIRLLARAFTHPQVGFNHLTLGDNQRMEFLGDSVLQFVVSIFLYRHFPEHHEGHLTLLRSSLVNNRTQADIARQLGLDKYINFGFTGLKNIREKLLADVLESLLAALYVDKGLKHVEAFCRACFFPRVEENIVNQEWIDAKSQLQQCCLALREEGNMPDLPEYKVLQNTGPAHRKRYQIVVYYKGKRCGRGEGQSIHQAEMAAAKDALSSSYFPELARQKHHLDEKHQVKRTRQYDPSPKPREQLVDDPPVQEPLWVDNE